MLTDRRFDKLQRERAALEMEYRNTLLVALRRCATGTWGLFGQNDHARQPGAPDAEALLALGAQISDLRQTLGVAEPFDLHRRLLELRRLKGPNELGEAKLARQWLDELQPS